MPQLTAKLGSWDVENLHMWKDRAVLPTFRSIPLFDQETKIATIGSCFAENVVKVLRRRGFNATMHPGGLWYNTYSIAQEISFLLEGTGYQHEALWQLDNGLWVHPFKNYSKQFKTQEELLTWSESVDALAKKTFLEAEVIVITLGLTEIWKSTHTGNVFIQIPPPDIHRRGASKFSTSTVAENLENLKKIYDVIRQHTKAKIILTVSPVALHATFRNMDVRIANNISKSTLLTAALEFAETHSEVYYFHSYDIVMSVDNPSVFFEEDRRHVKNEGVELIINEFLHCYGSPTLHTSQTELGLLTSIPMKRTNDLKAAGIVSLEGLRRALRRTLGG